MSLSAIIITHNEEANIARVLRSVAFANERIVIDAHSTDRTMKIAAREGARVFTRSWTGYGAQKNYGLAQARSEWALFVDADEEVSPELQAQIVTTLHQADRDFWWLRIVTVFLGRPLRHLFGHNPRLFRRVAGRWTDAAVHEQVVTAAGDVVRLGDDLSRVLRAPLLHHSHTTIRSYLARMHQYTTLDAAQMATTDRHRSGRVVVRSWLLPWWLALRQFTKLFVYRRGVLDGWAGWVWCGVSAYYEWEMGVKYLRHAAVPS